MPEAQPQSGVDAGTLVAIAARAPSSHNTQPWRFRAGTDAVELLADRTRALPINDPDDRELTISCGAALFNLRVALAAAGRDVEVELGPWEDRPDLLARIAWRESPAGAKPSDLAELAPQISRRRTIRGAFEDRLPPQALLGALVEAATREGIEAKALTEVGEREAAAELVAEGDRRQFSDPAWRRELTGWMGRNGAEDGLRGGVGTRLAIRHLNLGARTAESDRELALTAPILLVAGTRGDGPREWLRAGQALQRLLLTAAASDFHGGYLNQPMQVRELRGELRTRLGLETAPQVLVRIGRPKRMPRPSPRRAVGEILERSAPR